MTAQAHDVLVIVLVVQLLEMVRLIVLALVLCSIWPRRKSQRWDTGDENGESHETTGLVDVERNQPTVLCSGNREKAK